MKMRRDKKIASLEYKHRDVPEDQWREMLITLRKFGFSPAMAGLVANAESGKAKEIVNLCNGLRCSKSCVEPPCDWSDFYREQNRAEARKLKFGDL